MNFLMADTSHHMTFITVFNVKISFERVNAREMTEKLFLGENEQKNCQLSSNGMKICLAVPEKKKYIESLNREK